MCGITSIITNSNNNSLKKFLINMNNKISHRGPDSEGYWNSLNGNVFFGHKRLSIVDLSKNGDQPMHSKDKNFTIVFNGEIYNHLEIRKKYFSDHNFKSHCDTETLIELICLLGIRETLNIIDGMFSFIVFDNNKKKVYLARDKLGEKPLYYSKINQLNNIYFIVSSEVKSFSEFPEFHKEINTDAISYLLKYKYIPAPITIYKNTFKLRQGHFAEINLNDMSFTEQIYWDIEKKISNSKAKIDKHNNIDYKANLKEKLEKTVRGQLLGDVEIGCFLSGGIDSSLVASIMSSVHNSSINTFSVGFDNVEFDESKKAREISKILGTNHNELILNEKDIIGTIPDIVNAYDEPFSDSSQIPTFLISKFASSKLKVCLSGDGGDELFGGYNRYLFVNKYWKYLELLPLMFRKNLSNLMQFLSPKTIDMLFNLIRYKKYDFYGDKIHKISNSLKFNSFSEFNDYVLSDLHDHNNPLINSNIHKLNLLNDNTKYLNKVEILMMNDLKFYLPDDILVKVDRAAMKNSLETRMPFLSKEIIDFAWQIPFDQKIKNNKSKYILKNLLKDYIPEELIEKKKKGFALPLADWFRNDLYEWVDENLKKNEINKFNIFNFNKVSKIWDEHKLNKKNNHSIIWSIITIRNWLKNN
tara:strand:- start:384 stop:2309 length:1926 start_codon:yes stop_codon:yes gene_type:complete